MSNPLLLRRRALMAKKTIKYYRLTSQVDGNTLSIDKVGNPTNNVQLEYSLNGGAFSDYIFGTTLQFDEGEYVEWRRKSGNDDVCFNNSHIAYYGFNPSDSFVASGNPFTLLTNNGDYEFTTIYTRCFHGVFVNNIVFYDDFIIPDSVLTINQYMLTSNNVVGKLMLNKGLQSIYDNAFENCGFSGHLDIPDTVTYIGISAFLNNINLTSLKLSQNITEIKKYCFSCNAGLSSSLSGDLIIPNNVTKIGESCFRGYSSSTINDNLVIGSSVTSIGYMALTGYFKNVILLPNIPPTDGTQNHCYGRATNIYVPYSSDHSVLELYKTTSPYSSYASKIHELDEDGNIPS